MTVLQVLAITAASFLRSSRTTLLQFLLARSLFLLITRHRLGLNLRLSQYCGSEQQKGQVLLQN